MSEEEKAGGEQTKNTTPSSQRSLSECPPSEWLPKWKQIQDDLREKIDPQVFQAYIRPLQILSYEKQNKLLSLEVPSRFVKQHVDSHFGPQLKKACSAVFGEDVALKLSVTEGGSNGGGSNGLAESTDANGEIVNGKTVVRSGSNQNGLTGVIDSQPQKNYVVVKRTKSKSNSSSGKSSENTGLIPRYTFGNFVVGSGNQFCHAASMHVAENPGAAYNPLFIYGGVGLGKTHLLHAIGNAVLQASPEKKVLYLSSETFTNELILALRYAKMDEFKNRFRNIDVLLIDDIQFMCGKERTQEEFFHTFNALYSAKHQIVITSDKLPQEIPGIEERLQTRFAWGLTADIQAPDFETRVAILNRKASLDQFDLPESVAHFIAENISSNVRELEGALTRLHALCSLQNIEITKELAESALKPLMKKKKVHLSIEEIQKVVAQHFSIKVSEMVSKRRTKNLSFPRHVAMYLCRKHTTSSYPEIGSKFGGRDHSSVIHAANVVTAKVKDSKDVRNHVLEIEEKLFEQ